MKAAGPEPDRAIDEAFWATLMRLPSPSEKAKSQALLRKLPAREALSHLGLALFNTNEFLYLE